MSGLVLSLKADEKFLVNGALLINGSKRSQIRIGGDDVNVLRLSDALHPSEITTPVRRVYYAAQIFLSGDAKPSDIAADIQKGLSALELVFKDTPLLAQIQKSKTAAAAGRYYSLICALRPLLRLEAELLDVPVPSICLEEPLKNTAPDNRLSLRERVASPELSKNSARPSSHRPVLSLLDKTG